MSRAQTKFLFWWLIAFYYVMVVADPGLPAELTKWLLWISGIAAGYCLGQLNGKEIA